ncbi:MAG: hypothetical protein ACJ8F1_11625 [Polyangia bacterium]
MTWWRILGIASAAAAVLGVDARSAAAAPESCVAAVRAFTCDPLPDDHEERRATLAAWDAGARSAVSQHRLRDAARLFGCLLLADPRPEHASNLSVALKQSGDLSSALAAATCAEQLNAESSEAQARARARREAIEGLLAALIPGSDPTPRPPLAADSGAAPAGVTVAAPPVNVAPTTTGAAAWRDDARTVEPARETVTSRPEPAPARPKGALVRIATLALTGALLAGATFAYVVAHDDASRFNQEQMTNGFTARAQSLRQSAQTWQGASIAGFVGAGLAGVAAVITW